MACGNGKGALCWRDALFATWEFGAGVKLIKQTAGCQGQLPVPVPCHWERHCTRSQGLVVLEGFVCRALVGGSDLGLTPKSLLVKTRR